MKYTNIIVGGGLTGLSAANRLEKLNIDYVVLEADEKIGGRIQTEIIQEFQIDRGFQVFFDCYQYPQQVLSIKDLDLGFFGSGALIGSSMESAPIAAHPFKEPQHLLSTLFHSSFTITDKIALLKLIANSLIKKIGHDAGSEISTKALLEQSGLSDRAINDFFRPFFGGVFLDPTLQTSSKFFDFTFRNFVTGNACLPKLGMGEIPKAIAASIPNEKIKCGTKVTAITETSVTLSTGETLFADSIILATDADTCATLLKRKKSFSDSWRHTYCFHFAAPVAPYAEPMIFLNTDATKKILHLCPLTNINPSYSPDNRALISVTAHADVATDIHALTSLVTKELNDICGAAARAWELIDARLIRKALPNQSVGSLTPWHRTAALSPTLFMGGDFTENSSIDGAVNAGITLAQMVASRR